MSIPDKKTREIEQYRPNLAKISFSRAKASREADVTALEGLAFQVATSPDVKLTFQAPAAASSGHRSGTRA